MTFSVPVVVVDAATPPSYIQDLADQIAEARRLTHRTVRMLTEMRGRETAFMTELEQSQAAFMDSLDAMADQIADAAAQLEDGSDTAERNLGVIESQLDRMVAELKKTADKISTARNS